jgi:hypothetical protein
VNPEGIVTAKFFNEANNDRTTAANILIREFDDEGQRQGSAETKHLTLNWSASNHTLRPGQRAALVLDVDLEPRMQLYAPGKHRYITVDWELDDLEGLAFLDPKYPESETKYLEAIDETVPVYHDSLTIVRDIHLLGGREMPDALAGKKEIEVSGRLRYQACDDKKCYVPATIPLTWKFELQPHDLIRAPEELQRGAGG